MDSVPLPPGMFGNASDRLVDRVVQREDAAMRPPSTQMKGRLNGLEVMEEAVGFLTRLLSPVNLIPLQRLLVYTNMENGSEVLLGLRKKQGKCI